MYIGVVDACTNSTKDVWVFGLMVAARLCYTYSPRIIMFANITPCPTFVRHFDLFTSLSLQRCDKHHSMENAREPAQVPCCRRPGQCFISCSFEPVVPKTPSHIGVYSIGRRCYIGFWVVTCRQQPTSHQPSSAHGFVAIVAV